MQRKIFCLCYNNRTRSDGLGSDVEVMPVCLPSLEWTSGQDQYRKSMVRVARSRLVPLDPPLVKKHCGDNTLARDYLLALMCFADWDDFSASTFVWPASMVAMFSDPAATNALCRRAMEHPLSKTPYGKKHRSKVILFVLCSERLGIAEDFIESDFQNLRSTPEICHLLSQLSSICVDKEENCVQRTSSRVGDDYQVDVPPFECPPSRKTVAFTITNRCYSGKESSKVSDSEIRAYLGSVQALKEKNLTAGHLVEFPTAVEDACLAYEQFRKQFPADHYSPRHCQILSLNRGLADMRRVKKKGTSFGFVEKCSIFTPDIEAEDDAPTAESSFKLEMVDIKAELRDYQVPLRLCRILFMPMDQALQILYENRFDISSALLRVSEELSSLNQRLSNPNSEWISGFLLESEIKPFFAALQRYYYCQ